MILVTYGDAEYKERDHAMESPALLTTEERGCTKNKRWSQE